MTTSLDAPNKAVTAGNGIDYAYRALGDGPIPLVLLQHFRGNLDDRNPALIDALGATRPVVTSDNTGVRIDGDHTGHRRPDGERRDRVPHRDGLGRGRHRLLV